MHSFFLNNNSNIEVDCLNHWQFLGSCTMSQNETLHGEHICGLLVYYSHLARAYKTAHVVFIWPSKYFLHVLTGRFLAKTYFVNQKHRYWHFASVRWALKETVLGPLLIIIYVTSFITVGSTVCWAALTGIPVLSVCHLKNN